MKMNSYSAGVNVIKPPAIKNVEGTNNTFDVEQRFGTRTVQFSKRKNLYSSPDSTFCLFDWKAFHLEISNPVRNISHESTYNVVKFNPFTRSVNTYRHIDHIDEIPGLFESLELDEGFVSPGSGFSNMAEENSVNSNEQDSKTISENSIVLKKDFQQCWHNSVSLTSVQKLPFVSEIPQSITHLLNIYYARSGLTTSPLVLEISLPVLVRDINYLLCGITSKSFLYNEVQNTFSMRAGLYMDTISPELLSEYCRQFIRCADCYVTLRRFASKQEETHFLIYSVFCKSLQHVLNLYKDALALFDWEKCTMAELSNFVIPWSARLEFLCNFCFLDVESHRHHQPIFTTGVRLLDYVYSCIRKVLSPSLQHILFYIFQQCCNAYLELLGEWIFQGHVSDRTELFVSRVEEPENCRDRPWLCSYVLKQELVPQFLTEFCEEIFTCGAFVHMLKISYREEFNRMMQRQLFPKLKCALTELEINLYIDEWSNFESCCGIGQGSMKWANELASEVLGHEESAKNGNQDALENEKVNEAPFTRDDGKICANNRPSQLDSLIPLDEIQSGNIIREDLVTEAEVQDQHSCEENCSSENGVLAEVVKLEESVLLEESHKDGESEIKKIASEEMEKNRDIPSVVLHPEPVNEDMEKNRDVLSMVLDPEPVNEDMEKNRDIPSIVLDPEPVSEEMEKNRDVPSMVLDPQPSETNIYVTSVSENRKQALKNKAKVLQDTFATPQVRPRRTFSDTKEQKNKRRMMKGIDLAGSDLCILSTPRDTEAARNRLKVMSSEFGICVDTPMIRHTENTEEAKNRRRMMSSAMTEIQKSSSSNPCVDTPMIRHNENTEEAKNRRRMMSSAMTVIQKSSSSNPRSSASNLISSINELAKENQKFENHTNPPPISSNYADTKNVDSKNELTLVENFGSQSPVLEQNLPVHQVSKSSSGIEADLEPEDMVRKQSSAVLEIDFEFPKNDLAYERLDFPKRINTSDAYEDSSVWSSEAVSHGQGSCTIPTTIGGSGVDPKKCLESCTRCQDMSTVIKTHFQNIRPQSLFSFLESTSKTVVPEFTEVTEDIDTLTASKYLRASIIVPLKIQLKLVDDAILRLFIEDMKCFHRLKCLRNYFLLQESEFLFALENTCFPILEQLVSSSEGRTNIYNVWNNVAAQFDQRLSFNFEENFTGPAVEMLKSVCLRYDVYYPLNTLITEHVLADYNKAFQLIVSLAWTVRILKNDFSDLRQWRNGIGMQYREVHSCRYMMSQCVRMIQQYVQHNVIETCWKDLIRTFSEKQLTLETLYKGHICYLENVVNRLMVGHRVQDTRFIDTLLKVFSTISEYHVTLKRGKWRMNKETRLVFHTEFQKLEQLRQQFSQTWNILRSVVKDSVYQNRLDFLRPLHSILRR